MLSISGLSRRFPARRRGDSEVLAVDDVNLDVGAGEFFTLLGPSGCGKTTTLRCVAGLEKPTDGKIVVDGRTLYSSSDRVHVDPNSRGLGMVFQSYAIWPHMNVFNNVAFPLTVRGRRSRPSKSEIRERVERALEVVHLGPLASRNATDLSGGQQQRLALARALVMEPPLLLLDEPLSNLDAKLREDMRFELARLQREIGVTSVYVTHDQVEALAMSSRIAVMRAGRVEQIGTPKEVYSAPRSLFVADFIGSSNFVPGKVVSVDDGDMCRVLTDAGSMVGHSRDIFAGGESVVVAVRSEAVGLTVVQAATATAGEWSGRVVERVFLGETLDHVVEVSGIRLKVRTSSLAGAEPGAAVKLSFDSDLCSVLPAE